MSHYVLKERIEDLEAEVFVFDAVKTMYGGKHIAAGDVAFLFASDHEGGSGLFARGVVTSAEPVPRVPGVARQTPRVNVVVRRTGTARRPLGRTELRRFSDWGDGLPETELNFKFYRQATNKIAGVGPEVATFLNGFFDSG